jgi:hypothetical protein
MGFPAIGICSIYSFFGAVYLDLRIWLKPPQIKQFVRLVCACISEILPLDPAQVIGQHDSNIWEKVLQNRLNFCIANVIIL